MNMKPRKKQRTGTEAVSVEIAVKGKGEATKKEKKRPVLKEPEESSEDEGLDEEVEDGEPENDEMVIDSTDDSDGSDSDDFQDVKSKKRKKKSKDPAAFATAMSAILSSSLKAHSRADPILVRSKSHSKSLETAKADHRIRKAISAQRKALRSVGHVEDLSTHDAKDIAYEQSMRKTAQRGVIKLFNAVRASQIKAEEALSQTKGISRGEREEKVKEMSREGFLNLIKSG